MPKQSSRNHKKLKSIVLIDVTKGKKRLQPAVLTAINKAQNKIAILKTMNSNQIRAFHNGARTTLNKGRHK